MRCHNIEYEILGQGSQIAEITLQSGKTVIAEAGMMNYFQQGVKFETKLGDGSDARSGVFGKMFSAGKRMLSGESLFVTHFTNESSKPRIAAFAAPYPGTIVPLDLSQYNEKVYCQKDAFLCAAFGTRLDIELTKRIGTAGFFGGEGFILESITGDGTVFLHAGGIVIEKKLDGDELHVDTGSLVGFTEGIDYDIKLVGGLKSMIFGGEGLCLTKLSGSGTVWLQSLPFPRLAERIVNSVPVPSHNHK